MSDDLHALIRLNRNRVDERRRELARLLRRAEKLAAEDLRLKEEIIREQQAVRRAEPEVGRAYGPFATRVATRRNALAKESAAMEAQIATVRERLGDAYRQLRTTEIAQQVRHDRRTLAARRREQAMLDEIGLRRHRANRRRAPGDSSW